MSDFSHVLKTWRGMRRLSQLDLALEAGVSARHISFLETGRARPSREMVERLGEAMALPLEARNRLHTGAGFAARYAGRTWDDAELAPIRRAVSHTLARHAPFPAMAIDRVWTVVQMNTPAEALFAPLGLAPGGSFLELMVSDHLPPLVENWPEVAHHAARRLRTESVAQGGVPALDAVADHLAREAVPGDGAGPVVPVLLNTGTQRLALFATIARFGTPGDVTLDDLQIELWFPADAETEAYFGG